MIFNTNNNFFSKFSIRNKVARTIYLVLLILLIIFIVLYPKASASFKGQTNHSIDSGLNSNLDPGILSGNGPIVLAGIGSHSYSLEIANTEAKREKGLGDRLSLGGSQGMLFVFDTPGKYGFWMKDTYIPLDMIWLDQNGVVVYVKKNALPESFPQVFQPEKNSTYVIELNSGKIDAENVKIGDKIFFQKNN